MNHNDQQTVVVMAAQPYFLSNTGQELIGKRNHFSHAFIRNPYLLGGVTILGVLVLAALFPHLFSSIDPLEADPLNALQPPSAINWMGTDNIGRDIWSRVIAGTRTSIGMGLGATLIAAGIGTLLGVLAGLAGKKLDSILNGLFDVLFAFPDLLLALLMITVLGTGSFNAMLAIGLGGIPGFARMMRGEIISIRHSSYIESSTALGVSRHKVIVKHIIPNAIGPVAVLASLYVGKAIIYSSALSFLGLGPDRPTPEWGLMLADAQLYLGLAPWVAVFPGGAIMIAAIGSVLLARGLQRRQR